MKNNLLHLNKRFDFAWGDPICVRKVLAKHNKLIITNNIESLGYAPDFGMPELEREIRRYIQYTTGLTYDHVYITTGTTFSVNTALRVLKKLTTIESVNINRDCFYYYPNMIELQGLSINYTPKHYAIDLLDSPSNPNGKSQKAYGVTTIWDSVYHNPTFINTKMDIPSHSFNCGSLSKGLGIPGLRIGYIAFNGDFYRDAVERDIKYQLCTVSALDQQYAIQILTNLDYDSFFKDSNAAVNNNRIELNRLKYLFGEDSPENGMFYVGNLDASLIKLLDSCSVKYVVLPSGLLRLNLAQDNQLTKEMVDSIIRKDRIK